MRFASSMAMKSGLVKEVYGMIGKGAGRSNDRACLTARAAQLEQEGLTTVSSCTLSRRTSRCSAPCGRSEMCTANLTNSTHLLRLHGASATSAKSGSCRSANKQATAKWRFGHLAAFWHRKQGCHDTLFLKPHMCTAIGNDRGDLDKSLKSTCKEVEHPNLLSLA